MFDTLDLPMVSTISEKYLYDYWTESYSNSCFKFESQQHTYLISYLCNKSKIKRKESGFTNFRYKDIEEVIIHIQCAIERQGRLLEIPKHIFKVVRKTDLIEDIYGITFWNFSREELDRIKEELYLSVVKSI